MALHTVTDVEPDSGWPGTVVTVRGTGFPRDLTRIVVRFNGVQAPAEAVTTDGTELTTRVPQGATTGTLAVLADHGEGFVRVDGPVFTVTSRPPAVIDELVPARAYAGVVSEHRILGSGFASDAIVWLDTSRVDATIESETEISFSTPEDLEVGSYPVKVEIPYSSTSNVVQLEVEQPLDVLRAVALSPTEVRVTFTGGPRPTSLGAVLFTPTLEVVDLRPDDGEADSWLISTETQRFNTYTVNVQEAVTPDGRPLRSDSGTFVGFGGLPATDMYHEYEGCYSFALMEPVAVSATGGEIWVTERGGNQLQSMKDNRGFGIALGVTPAGFAPLVGNNVSLGCPGEPTETLALPRGVVVRMDDGGLVFADTGHGRVLVYRDGALSVLVDQLPDPLVLGRINDGRLAVGTSEDQVYLLSYADSALTLVGSGGTGDGEFRLGIAEGDSPQVAAGTGDEWFIVEPGNHRVQRFSGTTPTGWLGRGHESGSGFQLGGTPVAGTGEGEIATPQGIAIDYAGQLVVVHEGRPKILRFSHDGTYLHGTTSFQGQPGSIAIDQRNRLWVPFPEDNRLALYQL